jgi:cytochrome P450
MSESIPAERKYDLYSHSTKANPYPMFAKMREEDPVFMQLGMDGKTPIWFLTRFEDVQGVLSDESRFVRDPKNAFPPEQLHQPSQLEALLNNHMLNKDGEEHRRLRNLIGQAFTPTRVKNLRPRVQAIADELVAQLQSKTSGELMSEYAFQLPIIVISELLGIPTQDRERFKLWSNAMIAPALTPEAQTQAGARMQEFVAYLGALFAERKQHPQDDLISALVQAEEAGERLNEAELYSTTMLLIVAGHETTVNLIGNAVLALLKNPETLAVLRQHPEKMESALEEFLRFDTPVERVSLRWASKDTLLHGHQIKRGELVMGIVGAANRDPERFPNPETLDIERDNKRHLAFGHGIHYCVGAPLARLEGEIALNTLLQNLPKLRLAVPENELVWQTLPRFRGLSALPLRWD